MRHLDDLVVAIGLLFAITLICVDSVSAASQIDPSVCFEDCTSGWCCANSSSATVNVSRLCVANSNIYCCLGLQNTGEAVFWPCQRPDSICGSSVARCQPALHATPTADLETGRNNIGIILGVVGGLVAIGAISAFVYCFIRRKKHEKRFEQEKREYRHKKKLKEKYKPKGERMNSSVGDLTVEVSAEEV
jgi:hypothetical protein